MYPILKAEKGEATQKPNFYIIVHLFLTIVVVHKSAEGEECTLLSSDCIF